MHKGRLFVSAGMGFALGAVVLNAAPAVAQMAVIDTTSIVQEIKSVAQQTGILDVLNAMNTVQKAMNDTMASINGALGLPTYGTTNQLLQQGFTQNANYAKAQVGAWQQITDASNLANAQFRMQLRQAQIRDDHTVSPNNCTALDGGVSTTAAAVQAYDVAYTIEGTHNLRGQAQPGMPSYFGAAQGTASMAAEHLASYCDAKDVAAGLCAGASQTPDGDSQFSSLFNSDTYASQQAINAAKDYAINLIEPVAPAALRGNQLGSIQGQEAAVKRRSFDARMSLAQSTVDDEIAMQTPSVPITQLQQQYLTNMGLQPPANGNISWYQALKIEAERRVSDVTWASTLHEEPPVAVEREIAQELALSNYLAFQSLKLGMHHIDISASQLAESTSRDFLPTSQLPTPSIAATQ